jgi:hypothetical protein
MSDLIRIGCRSYNGPNETEHDDRRDEEDDERQEGNYGAGCISAFR